VVNGGGFPPGSPLDVTLFSTPVLLGRTTADAAGNYRVVVAIPAGTELGLHAVVVSVHGGAPQAQTSLIVSASPVAEAPEPTNPTVPAGTLSFTGSDVRGPASLALALLLLGLLMIGATLKSSREHR
jgi:hypothetical protein